LADAVQRPLELAALELRQETEPSEIDAEQRGAGGNRECRGPQQRPVPTEHEDQVEIRPEAGLVGRLDRAAQAGGVGRERAYFDPALLERTGEPASGGLRFGAIAVQEQADTLHGASPTARSMAASSFASPRFRVRWRKNSRFPAGPTSGDGFAPRSAQPASRYAPATRRNVSVHTAGSRTTPPRSTRDRGASNCGFTNSTRSASPAEAATSASRTVAREMNDRSAATRSTGSSPTVASSSARTFVRSSTCTRGSLRSDHASWPYATSAAITR